MPAWAPLRALFPAAAPVPPPLPVTKQIGDDFGTRLFKTTDYGETWTSITTGLPKDHGALHTIREHPRNRDLLFAGGEFGLYLSFDRGQTSISSGTMLWIPESVIAFGMVLLSLQFLARTIQALLGLPLEDHRIKAAPVG